MTPEQRETTRSIEPPVDETSKLSSIKLNNPSIQGSISEEVVLSVKGEDDNDTPPTTPFGISRYVLLLLFCFYTFATGSVYWGWDGFQDSLYKSEAFSWLCRNTSDNFVNIGGKFYPTCADRKNAIADMYTTAFVCHFGFSAFAGVILDVVGPKICSMIGQTFHIFGWMLLAHANQSISGAYYAAVGFIGAGTDTAYLPILSLGNLFPGNESLVLSILGSLRSVSFAMPVILARIYTTDSFAPGDFTKFCYGYLGVANGAAMIICLLLIPMRPFRNPRKTAEEEAKQPTEKEAAAAAAARGRRRLSVLYTTGTMMMPPPASTSAGDMVDIASELRGCKTPDYSERKSSYMLSPGERRTSIIMATSTAQDAFVPPHLEGNHYSSFLSNIRRPEFFLIVPFFCLCLIRGEFFAKSNKDLLVTSAGDDCYTIFSVFNILTFLPGPVFGKLCDTIGILWVILILNISAINLYFFVIFDVLAVKIIGVLFYFVFTSFVLSNLYCYVAHVFPTEHFGKLTGLASFIGGMFSLLSIGLYRLCTGSAFQTIAPYQFAPVCGIMMAFGVINCALWVVMKRIHTRRIHVVAAARFQEKLMDVVSVNPSSAAAEEKGQKTEDKEEIAA